MKELMEYRSRLCRAMIGVKAMRDDDPDAELQVEMQRYAANEMARLLSDFAHGRIDSIDRQAAMALCATYAACSAREEWDENGDFDEVEPTVPDDEAPQT